MCQCNLVSLLKRPFMYTNWKILFLFPRTSSQDIKRLCTPSESLDSMASKPPSIKKCAKEVRTKHITYLHTNHRDEPIRPCCFPKNSCSPRLIQFLHPQAKKRAHFLEEEGMIRDLRTVRRRLEFDDCKSPGPRPSTCFSEEASPSAPFVRGRSPSDLEGFDAEVSSPASVDGYGKKIASRRPMNEDSLARSTPDPEPRSPLRSFMREQELDKSGHPREMKKGSRLVQSADRGVLTGRSLGK